MYTNVANNLELFKIDLPKTIVPIPSNNDYGVGFIRRYFCQKVNDSNGHVYEIDNEVYSTLKLSPFWKVVDVKWRITGPLNATYKQTGELDDIGVIASNRAALSTSSYVLKNIGLYLPNLLQFYK
jgi:hypothetical protein